MLHTARQVDDFDMLVKICFLPGYFLWVFSKYRAIAEDVACALAPDAAVSC